MYKGFTGGLVSVSFRNLSPEKIIRECVRNGLDAIEWGGDVHIPAGNVSVATQVGEMTRAAGLEVAAYGSYYKLGLDSPEGFSGVLDSASALGAKIIRVWGGCKDAGQLSAAEYETLCAGARGAADAAAARGVTLALECHNGTVTSDCYAAKKFLDDCGRENLKMLWQPNQLRDEGYNLEAARLLAGDVVNLHIFHWDAERRYPLHRGKEIWRRYLDIFEATGKTYKLLLEFMHNDSLDALEETAETLKAWIRDKN